MAYSGTTIRIPSRSNVLRMPSPTDGICESNMKANKRVSDLAAAFRASFKPTYHAKRRASDLKLAVDTKKAVNLEHRHVSAIPLPIIISDPSPQPEASSSVFRPLPPIPVAAAAVDQGAYPDVPQEVENIEDTEVNPSFLRTSSNRPHGARIQHPTGRPSLRCIIPVNLNVVHAEISKFSADSEFSAVSLSSAIPEVILGSPIVQGGRPINMDVNSPRPHRAYPIAVPEDMTRRMSWGCGEMEQTTIAISLPTPTSSPGSSTGPKTPDVDFIPKVSIKRKSDTDELEETNSQDRLSHNPVLEKRPKFERKEWTIEHQTQRRYNTRSVSAARRQL
ncbi:hypothetical protein FA15DRAFT_52359 [Coprinopsis marcescibilis]|uniref:Uncharacterized protein n=1 Tax=Coprinopsis marcescibilis TaxID=230819 RepID=A0A5C3KNH1_COPMA|nr:hypothetical protein FA15DRAFT_52359 [Coprinopsis marcescibilis]